ncbi:PTS system, mannose-specific IIB component [Secundilactobacillus oryzae JCM 18671]|uniref:PTS system, mannose-specific IIB component n=1 Tax=Secundilactobacillus oryzae JCM 18671 TaxID=1291743 RepID=A0A081BJE2_9LACO|nr:PTS sugar transporter subunit IIB [Secundilactobacillus oryzae]GAK48160.1 PTS system, mannose-specific IIB component [Secundilactobacillus oryzae JCM 18671]
MPFKIKLARIDNRLLHGQVATGWVNMVKPNRIFIVSDTVVNDALRKTLLVQAAPAGIKANVLSVDRAIKAYSDERLDSLQVLLLTEGPRDMERLVEGGISIPEINVGNMTFEEGKTIIASNLSVNDDDVAAFKSLNEHGTKLSRQQVPGDSAVDVMGLLKKADL